MAKAKKEEAKVKRVWAEHATATPVVRVSYSYITKPDTGKEFSDEKFKFAALLPKDRAEELKPLKLEILKVAKEAFGKDTKLKDIETPFNDGDEMEKEEYEGMVVFNIKSKRKPGVIVGKTKRKYNDLNEEEQAELALDNAGYYVIAMCKPSSYKRTITVEDAKGKTKNKQVCGVNLNLQSLWYVKDGERFGGGGDASSDFAEVDLDGDEFDDEGVEESTGEDSTESTGEEADFDDDDLL